MTDWNLQEETNPFLPRWFWSVHYHIPPLFFLQIPSITKPRGTAKDKEPGVEAHARSASTQQSEAGGPLQTQSQAGLHGEFQANQGCIARLSQKEREEEERLLMQVCASGWVHP